MCMRVCVGMRECKPTSCGGPGQTGGSTSLSLCQRTSGMPMKMVDSVVPGSCANAVAKSWPFFRQKLSAAFLCVCVYVCG